MVEPMQNYIQIFSCGSVAGPLLGFVGHSVASFLEILYVTKDHRNVPIKKEEEVLKCEKVYLWVTD